MAQVFHRRRARASRWIPCFSPSPAWS